MTTAYDFSAAAIAPAALTEAGVRTVMRYVSTPGNSKNISPAEYRQLVQAGITVGLVYETTADWMLGGYNAGLAAARSARTQATAAGYPSWHRIWYAADFEAASSQISTVLDCLHGCADAEGTKEYAAVYGDYDVCTAALAAGFAAPWQTVAWSSGRWCEAAVLRQTGRQTTCGGVQVDINEVTGQLFLLPAPTNESEDDVTTYYPIQVMTDPTGNPCGAGIATWPAGGVHVLQLEADPGKWGDTGEGQFQLAFILTSGPDVITTHVAKGSASSVAIELASVKGLNKAKCRGVSITRPDGKRWPWGGGGTQ